MGDTVINAGAGSNATAEHTSCNALFQEDFVGVSSKSADLTGAKQRHLPLTSLDQKHQIQNLQPGIEG